MIKTTSQEIKREIEIDNTLTNSVASTSYYAFKKNQSHISIIIKIFSFIILYHLKPFIFDYFFSCNY